MNVKINDTVVVVTGKYAAHKDIPAKKGKVIATSPKNGTVTVEGVNIHKKSQKARKANEVSQIVEIPAPIDASNVMVVCPSCDKAIRVKYSLEGKKHRVCPKCGATLDKAYTGKAAKNAAKKDEAPKKRERKRAKKAETAEAATEENGKAE